MNQTLLAVLALGLTALLVLNVTRSRVRDHRAVDTEQATVYATDAGLELLDAIRSKPFDAATAGASGLVARSDLTPLPFASGGTHAGAQDVDDFHGMQPTPLGAGSIPMQGTVEVEYVSEADLSTPSTTPTYAKRVTVYVWGEAVPDTLSLSQVVTYPQ